MRNVIFIDQIAQGGEQGWANPPEIKKYSKTTLILVWAGLIGYCFLFWWGALDGWKYVGRR